MCRWESLLVPEIVAEQPGSIVEVVDIARRCFEAESHIVVEARMVGACCHYEVNVVAQLKVHEENAAVEEDIGVVSEGGSCELHSLGQETSRDLALRH